ncbi:MAG: MraY family glycosyltransferase, partial [Nocardioidaceae bacterium]
MREYLTVFLVAATVSYLLGVVARELATRFGAVAQVRDRDVHAIPIPYFGGVAMLGGLVAAYAVARRLPFLSTAGANVFHDATIVLIGGAMICALGVIDDIIELDALTKFGGQVLAAAFLVLNGVEYSNFQLPGRGQFVLDPTQAALASVVVVVATVNAVNFVDGLDGLAAGVVCIGAVAFFAFSYKLADANGVTLAITAALLCAALGGACVGFLPHNFFPARMFMGDSGSMLIGLVLAGSAFTLTGQFATVDMSQGAGGSKASLLPTLLPIILPIAILVVPFADLLMAVVRRTRHGQPFYTPDKKHLHHRLL